MHQLMYEMKLSDISDIVTFHSLINRCNRGHLNLYVRVETVCDDMSEYILSFYCNEFSQIY